MLDHKAEETIRDELLEFHFNATDVNSTCSVLTPAIRGKLREMQSGQVLEVRVNDSTARSDIEAWCRLSGNTLLKITNNGELEQSFFIEKK